MTGDRKSTRLNSSHTIISYAVFCLKKKRKKKKSKHNREEEVTQRTHRRKARPSHSPPRYTARHCPSWCLASLRSSMLFFLKYGAAPEILPSSPPLPSPA